MANSENSTLDSLIALSPFNLLPPTTHAELAAQVSRREVKSGSLIFAEGDVLDGLFVLEHGAIDIETSNGELVSTRQPGEIMGDRGLLRDGTAQLTARTAEDSELLYLPKEIFLQLVGDHPAFADTFAHLRLSEPREDQSAGGLTALQVRDLMSPDPITCPLGTTVQDVAIMMRDNTISSVVVTSGDGLAGIVTGRDLTNKVLAENRGADTPVEEVMTPNPMTIAPGALGLDALMMLSTNKISHLPVSDGEDIIGLIGKTDLFRKQAHTASNIVSEIVQADSAGEMAKIMERTPEMFAQLVFSGARPSAICRRVSDLTDAITRRLLVLAEEKLGPPPVPYLWLACGSQGRQEQTGVSDQDNCLILDDAVTPDDDAYFAELAKFVSDGLDVCGYVYCPGDMMATNPRWRQPRRVWREYFRGWIAEPDPMAQMLASVMFDLRPIGGDESLFDDLQRETLEAARSNSIFVAHMVSNSLKHTPPLGLFRGFALIRSGEHKNMLDLKHSGIVPIVDLGRVYALQGAVEAVNTRDRLDAARDAGVLSQSGSHDLIDAYDLIAEIRLRHQADQIKRGETTDNFMAPGKLSDLERNHLRDAFMVIKTMQSHLAHSRSSLD